MPGNVTFEDGRTRFNDEGSRPSHITRSEALMEANKVMVSLKIEADKWLAGDMQKLSDLVAGAEQGPLKDSQGAGPDVSHSMFHPRYQRTVWKQRDVHAGRRVLRADQPYVPSGKMSCRSSPYTSQCAETGSPDGRNRTLRKGLTELTTSLRSLIEMYPSEN